MGIIRSLVISRQISIIFTHRSTASRFWESAHQRQPNGLEEDVFEVS